MEPCKSTCRIQNRIRMHFINLQSRLNTCSSSSIHFATYSTALALNRTYRAHHAFDLLNRLHKNHITKPFGNHLSKANSLVCAPYVNTRGGPPFLRAAATTAYVNLSVGIEWSVCDTSSRATMDGRWALKRDVSGSRKLELLAKLDLRR